MVGRLRAKSRGQDLSSLMKKLYSLQEDLGAKPPKDEQKSSSQLESVTMGRGSKAERRGNRFLELKSSIITRLKFVHKQLNEQSNVNRSVSAGNNPKDIIRINQEIREEIRCMAEEWNEMDALYKNEAKKRKSKFTKAELEVQQTLLEKLRDEIASTKQAQTIGFSRLDSDALAADLNSKVLNNLDILHTTPSNVSSILWDDEPSVEASLSSTHKMQLDQIQEKDKSMDRHLDQIEIGLGELKHIAMSQNEEVHRHNLMLNALGEKTQNVHEHQENLNAKMKDTLLKVGRSADKLCVDIMCLVLSIGFISVFYSISKNFV